MGCKYHIQCGKKQCSLHKACFLNMPCHCFQRIGGVEEVCDGAYTDKVVEAQASSFKICNGVGWECKVDASKLEVDCKWFLTYMYISESKMYIL